MMVSHHPSIEDVNDGEHSGNSSRRIQGLEEEEEEEEEGCFLENLNEELLFSVLTFVQPLDLLRSGCLVCTRFNRVIQEEAFWKYLESSEQLVKGRPEMPPFTKHQLQRYTLHKNASDTIHTNILELLEEGSVLPTSEEARRLKRNEVLVCAASTTDRPSEELENVLSSRLDQATHNFLFHPHFMKKWWSSRATPQPDTRNEVLVFATRAPVCVLTQVSIKPLLDPYMGHTIYSWKNTIIRAYLLPDEVTKLKWGYPCTFRPRLNSVPGDEIESGSSTRRTANRPFAARGTESQPPRTIGGSIPAMLLMDREPVYEAEYALTNPFSLETLIYLVPDVIANVVTFELVGKNTEQTQGSGYYACVETLDCRGIPLHALPPT